jgi:hypothetical protein
MELALKVYASQVPEVEVSLEKLRKRYARYAVSAEEVRTMMDKALGERTLTDELYRLRGK